MGVWLIAAVAHASYYRIAATNAFGTAYGAVKSFTTLPSTPNVRAEPASLVTRTSAQLNAVVNPEGSTVKSCEFEYGKTESYESGFLPCATLPGAGESGVPVSAIATGLSESTTYYYRIKAENAFGTTYSGPETLMTLPDKPTVLTQAASAITEDSAALNATVNPEGAMVTTCELEYGRSLSLGSSAACASLPPGAGESPEAVSALVGSLSASTAYYYRIAAGNSWGTSYGRVDKFVTRPKTEGNGSLEYGECVAQKKGKYENANCTAPAAKKGSFEWAAAGSCYAKKKGKYAESGCLTLDEKKGKPAGKWEKAASTAITTETGAVTIETPGVVSIVCTQGKGAGAITAPKADTEQLTFTGCEANSAPCQNGAAGEITTSPLETTLIEPSAGVAETVFDNLALTGHPYSATFFCNVPGTFVRMKGATGGTTTPTNVMGTSTTTVFDEATTQNLRSEFVCSPGTPPEVWSGEKGATECPANGIPFFGPGSPPAGGEFPSLQLETSHDVTSSPVEIRG